MPSFVKYTRIFLGFLLVKKFNIRWNWKKHNKRQNL